MGDLVPYKPRELERDRQRMPALRFAPRPPRLVKRFMTAVAREVGAQGRDMAKVGADVHSERMTRKQNHRKAQDGQGNIYIDNRGGKTFVIGKSSGEGWAWAVAVLLVAVVALLAFIGREP